MTLEKVEQAQAELGRLEIKKKKPLTNERQTRKSREYRLSALNYTTGGTKNMLVADIESLVSETLIDNDEFQEDFCAGCEAVTVEEGHTFCPCEFIPSDEDCWRRKDWGRIAGLIHKLADMAGTGGD